MNTTRGTIVFITGPFLSNNYWSEWIGYFQNEGYNCIAPAWPYKDAAAEELRNRSVDDPIARTTISELTEHFASIINGLPEKPILIGHSLGGLVVQLLLQQELGAAGVAIHSFPPRGIYIFWLPFLKAVWRTMVLFRSSSRTYLMSFRKWRYTIANGMGYERQKELYYWYAVPESTKLIRESFKCTAKIDFTKPRAPLLLTSGGNDKLVPASLNYCVYKKYAVARPVIDYIEFKTHNHLLLGGPAWKAEADFILVWLQGLHN